MKPNDAEADLMLRNALGYLAGAVKCMAHNQRQNRAKVRQTMRAIGAILTARKRGPS